MSYVLLHNCTEYLDIAKLIELYKEKKFGIKKDDLFKTE